MITILIIALILAVVLIAVSGVCVLLLDPLIAILIVLAIYKVSKRLFFK